MVDNKLYVILHGHFYQPPREDPWTGEIDRQPSAGHFHDWNERINKECYAANAASRVLDNQGRIEAIINNYNYFSFNFGPTLIDWLLKNDPYTYRKIIEADNESITRNNGHGNAIAQVYNHIIMPLANNNDKITQIEWGIRHFEHHFKRRPEGIWLAETAVNDYVAELLIDYGMKFIILAPTQAQAVRPVHSDSDEWFDVSHNNIDPSKPYILKESNGEIAVFFYYGDIATKLSFQHLLQKVDYLRGELLAHNDPQKEVHLVHVGTDGETYGHHEPFGDMCLARLIYENHLEQDFIFTNYGNFLEMYPPQDYVRLKEGNENLGTAWSCAHGVDRWRRDCGCSTGAQAGWNQKWREPLRNAFDFLRETLFEAVSRELAMSIHDIWKARNDYIDIILAASNEAKRRAIDEFFKKYAKKRLDDYDRSFILRIMEALCNEMLMFTSCGWFFADVSGIETVQDLAYAGRLLFLTEDILPSDTRERFLEILHYAKSNIPSYQDGEWIYENFVEKHIFDENCVINEYLLNILLTNRNIKTGVAESMYFYGIKIIRHEEFIKGEWKINKFVVTLLNEQTLENEKYVAYIFRSDNIVKSFIKNFVDESLMDYLDKIIAKDNPKTIIRHFLDWFMKSYSMHNLKYDSKERILGTLFEITLKSLHKKFSLDDLPMDSYLQVIDLYRELGVNLSSKDLSAIKELFNTYIINGLEELERVGIDNYNFTDLIKILQTAKRANLDIGYEEVMPYVRSKVLEKMEEAILRLNGKELARLEKLIDFANISGMDFEKYEIQNLLYDTLEKQVNRQIRMPDKQTEECLIRLAHKFNIASHRFETKLKDN
jgi:alpha-amylase/alpha-mannosidase (GH57 family)